jgi:hypothetical protein
VRLEYGNSVRMGCWDIVDIPPYTMLFGLVGVYDQVDRK